MYPYYGNPPTDLYFKSIDWFLYDGNISPNLIHTDIVDFLEWGKLFHIHMKLFQKKTY